MLSNQNEKVLQTLFRLELLSRNANSRDMKKVDNKKIIAKKIGRNEHCPCGSGKKYKSCHGI